MKPSKTPTWQAEIPRVSFSPLRGDLIAEVCVIGGGLAGMLTAYMLAKEGKEVVVIESQHIGEGATGMTTAFITKVVDTSLQDLVKLFGTRKTKLVWESGQEAIETLERIILEEAIGCEFMRCSLQVFANSSDQKKELETEHSQAKKLGFTTHLRARRSLPFPNNGVWEIPHQAKFHPTKFLAELSKRTQDYGAKIFDRTEALEIKGKGPFRVDTSKGTVSAHDVVIATYAPLNNPKKTFMKKGMYTSYVFEVSVPKGILKEGLYQNLENPYHYLRLDAKGKRDRLIIGGEDHRQELPMSSRKSFAALEEYLKEILPGAKYEITRAWAGPILEPSDGLPLIGQLKPHKYVATAFSGNGMTYSTIAAHIITDGIFNRKNAWASVYDPTRPLTPYRLLKKGRDYVEEFIGGAVKNTFTQ